MHIYITQAGGWRVGDPCPIHLQLKFISSYHMILKIAFIFSIIHTTNSGLYINYVDIFLDSKTSHNFLVAKTV
jgi:hypothetical protein